MGRGHAQNDHGTGQVRRQSPVVAAVLAVHPKPADGPPPERAAQCAGCHGVPVRVWRAYDAIGVLSGSAGYEAVCAEHGELVARQPLTRS